MRVDPGPSVWEDMVSGAIENLGPTFNLDTFTPLLCKHIMYLCIADASKYRSTSVHTSAQCRRRI